MRRIVIAMALAFSLTTLASAQDPEERAARSPDELIAFLSLTDSNIACLDMNQDALREALKPSVEKLRELHRDLRQARRNEADTTTIEAAIAATQEEIASTRSSYSASAQACLTTEQRTALNQLIAAETLMNEVHQGLRYGLFVGTEEHGGGARTGAVGRRGRAGRGGGR